MDISMKMAFEKNVIKYEQHAPIQYHAQAVNQVFCSMVKNMILSFLKKPKINSNLIKS
jgi:hypothetical protein